MYIIFQLKLDIHRTNDAKIFCSLRHGNGRSFCLLQFEDNIESGVYRIYDFVLPCAPKCQPVLFKSPFCLLSFEISAQSFNRQLIFPFHCCPSWQLHAHFDRKCTLKVDWNIGQEKYL